MALVGIALVVAVVSVGVFVEERRGMVPPPTHAINIENKSVSVTYVTVDIAGSVQKPGIYRLTYPARIDDLLQKAGGMSDDADNAFVSRNVNRARILTDQEKIYIPSQNDIVQGVVEEYKRIIDYTQPVTTLQNSMAATTTHQENSVLTNINTAQLEELDELPGVGTAIGQAIIDKRPYMSIDELIKRSVVKQSVYDKIKNLITIQE